MALKNIFDTRKLLEKILLKTSQQDGLTISSQLDITDIPNYSPVHVLGEPHPFKFQTCVSQTDKDTLLLSIRSWPGNKTSDLSWPVVVEWKVSIINESTEKTLDFDPVTTTFIEPTSESPDGQDLPINLSQIKDFITDKSILLRWNIKLWKQPDTFIPEQGPSKTCDQHSMKEHIQAVLSLTQNIGKQYDPGACREKFDVLNQTLTGQSTGIEGTESMSFRIDKTDERIDKLIDNFTKETRKAAQCMSIWKDAINQVQALTGTDEETSDLTQTDDTVTEEEDTSNDENEGLLTTRELNFLLIGDPQTGKSATGNSILLESAFKTGQQTLNLPQVGKARIVVSTVDILVTVVEVSGSYLSSYKPTPFKLCPGGFDAILCIDEYRNITNNCSPVCSCLANTFIDDEALRSYGIVIINGGDSFKLDYPDMAIQDFLREISNTYEALEDKVQNRVMLFDNTTQSMEKKVLQVTKLVQVVESLPARRKTRFTEVEFMESETRILKSALQTLHTLRDASRVEAIKDLFAYYTIGPFEHNEEWHKIMSTIGNTPVKWRANFENNEHLITETDAFEVLIFGKPKESARLVMKQIGNMGVACQYKHLDLLTNCEEISNFTALLLVVSCAYLLPRDKDVLRKVITKYSHDACRNGILVVIDGGTVDLRVNNREFEEWCIKENDIIKDMLQACAGRAVLFDYETSDVMVTREQTANLIKMLHSLLLNSDRAPERDSTPVEKSSSYCQKEKRRKLN